MAASPDAPSRAALEARAYRRVTWRLIPFLLVCYVVAYLDRVNVGFAKLQMLGDLRMSETAYGIGAGIFFIGYFLFEVPSNLILHRTGARVWIARIMITWGVLSAAMMLVTNEWQFYVVRFFLGIAEAGFFPGIIYYLTQWYPASRRGRVLSLFITGIAVSGVIGGPVSGWILGSMSGVNGWAGWQWLFLLEGIPAILMGVAVYLWLDDSVERAPWLSDAERELLVQNLRDEAAGVEHASVFAALANPFVVLLAGLYFCDVMGLYAIGFWLPQLIRTMGVADAGRVGLLSALPYGVAAVTMVLVGRSSDRRRERRWHLAGVMLLGAAGLVLAGRFSTNLVVGLAATCAATVGPLSAAPIFWTLPPTVLRGASAAAGIAAINSVGNLAGFLSPYLIGVVKDATGETTYALYVIAAFMGVGAMLALLATSARFMPDSSLARS